MSDENDQEYIITNARIAVNPPPTTFEMYNDKNETTMVIHHDGRVEFPSDTPIDEVAKDFIHCFPQAVQYRIDQVKKPLEERLGFLEREVRRLARCRHCKDTVDNHGPDGKCLYLATVFFPMNNEEFDVHMQAVQTDLDRLINADFYKALMQPSQTRQLLTPVPVDDD